MPDSKSDAYHERNTNLGIQHVLRSGKQYIGHFMGYIHGFESRSRVLTRYSGSREGRTLIVHPLGQLARAFRPVWLLTQLKGTGRMKVKESTMVHLSRMDGKTAGATNILETYSGPSDNGPPGG